MAGSVTGLYYLYAIQSGSNNIAGVQEFSLSPQAAKGIYGGDGMLDPTHAVGLPSDPVIEFSSPHLATLLSAIGINGLAVTSGATVQTFWQTGVNAGGRATGSNHLKRVVTNGLIVPVRLSAPASGAAMLSYRLYITWDGTNNPVLYSASQALVGTPGVAECFTAGPVYLNGALICGEQGFELDFGIDVEVKKGGGEMWPSWASIRRRNPVLTLRTPHASLEGVIGETGAVAISESGGASATVAFLRKKSVTGNVADATAEHIALTFNAGIAVRSGSSAADPNSAEFGLELTPVADGTNAIVAVSAAAAIAAPSA